MDRITWLSEMRRDCEVKYDGWAPLYGEEYGLYSNATHIGIDQSQGMLARAKAQFPGVQFEKVGL